MLTEMKFHLPLVLFATLLTTACTVHPAAGCGALPVKSLQEVKNDLAVGCETLDRDYADYDAYKEYLEPLGMRFIRLQAGWAKCEKQKGVYDFAWLDHIIDDAVSRGLEPWLELSYGNPIYEGGGTPFLSGGWPRSREALDAWTAWTLELALRYKGKVHQWEIWNEPDLTIRKGGAIGEIVEIAFVSANIIKGIDPDAKIAAFGLAGPRHTDISGPLFKCLHDKIIASGHGDLFDWISYHGYHYVPEEAYFIDADSLKTVLARCGWAIPIWEGETGAPSQGYMGGALGDYPWSEISQAKWDLRRILNDHAHGVRTGIFSISDMNYASGDAIRKKNCKGLLETDADGKVVRPKLAYNALRNLVSVFDNLDSSCDSTAIKAKGVSGLAAYLFEDRETRLQSAVLWQGGGIPGDSHETIPASVGIKGFKCKNPVCIDLLDGRVFAPSYRRLPGKTILLDIPIYDSPVVICDKKLIY